MPKTKWGSVIFTAYKFFDSKELLFFAVPEDCHTVMLHYGDPDESYYIQRINI